MAGEAEIERMVVRLLGDASQYEKTLKRGITATESFAKKVNRQLQSVANGMRRLGRTMALRVTAPLLALGIASVAVGANFEKGFIGVRKTVDATEVQLADLRSGFKAMALEVPVAVEELLKIGESAGQLGIATDNVLEFTETIAAMGVATNLTTSDAATSLARFANITGLSQRLFSNLGSSIVALGNNMATTESEIASMGLRLAGVGTTVGLTDAQILAFAASLSSVGLTAEAGGTAFGKLLLRLQTAVALGGKELESFARVAGTSAADFAASFRTDASGAVIELLQGLRSLDKETKILALAELGLTDARMIRTILASSNAVDKFVAALGLSERAFRENTALAEEAARAYASFWSQVKLLQNQAKDLLAKVFEVMQPTLLRIIDSVKLLVKGLGNLSPEILKIIVIGSVILAAIGPVLLALAAVLSTIGFVAVGVEALVATIVFLGPELMALGAVAALGFSIMASAIAAAAAGLIALQKQTQAFTPLIEGIQAMASRIKAQLLPTLQRLGAAVRDIVVPVFESMFAILGTGIKLVTPVFLFMLVSVEQQITLLDIALQKVAATFEKVRLLGAIAATAVASSGGPALGAVLAGTPMQSLTGAKGGDGASATDGEPGFLEAVKRAVADTGTALADIGDKQKVATKSLEEWTRSQLINLATLGMTSRESRIYQSQLDNVSEATLNAARATSEALTEWENQIDIFRRARREIEQVDNTISSLADEVFGLKNGLDALDRLKLERLGASPEQLGEFDRLTREQGQLEASQKAQREAERKAGRTQRGLTMRNAAQVGTAEAASRISAFRAGAGPSSDSEETASNTGRIVEILEEIRDAEPLTVMDLGFGEGGLRG